MQTLAHMQPWEREGAVNTKWGLPRNCSQLKGDYLLCTIKYNGLDLTTLSKERLQLLVVKKSIGRDVFQLEGNTGMFTVTAVSEDPTAPTSRSRGSC